MTDKSNSTKPCFSICKLNDTPRSTMIVPRHCQKTKEWVVPRLLDRSPHPLAYEITQLRETPHFMAAGYNLCAGIYSVDCVSLWIQTNPLLTYCCVSQWIFLQWDILNLSFIRPWNQAPWVLAGLMTEWLIIAQSPCQSLSHGFESQS